MNNSNIVKSHNDKSGSLSPDRAIQIVDIIRQSAKPGYISLTPNFPENIPFTKKK